MIKTVVARDMDDNLYTVPIDELTWRPACYAIIQKDDCLLVLKQYNGYDLPGGGMDLGESFEDALAREVKEEAGVIIKNSHLVHASTDFFKRAHTKENNAAQSIALFFKADYVSGDSSQADLGEDEKTYSEGCVWLPLQELPKIKVAAAYDWRALLT